VVLTKLDVINRKLERDSSQRKFETRWHLRFDFSHFKGIRTGGADSADGVFAELLLGIITMKHKVQRFKVMRHESISLHVKVTI